MVSVDYAEVDTAWHGVRSKVTIVARSISRNLFDYQILKFKFQICGWVVEWLSGWVVEWLSGWMADLGVFHLSCLWIYLGRNFSVYLSKLMMSIGLLLWSMRATVLQPWHGGSWWMAVCSCGDTTSLWTGRSLNWKSMRRSWHRWEGVIESMQREGGKEREREREGTEGGGERGREGGGVVSTGWDHHELAAIRFS